jgi:hypothetical protein
MKNIEADASEKNDDTKNFSRTFQPRKTRTKILTLKYLIRLQRAPTESRIFSHCAPDVHHNLPRSFPENDPQAFPFRSSRRTISHLKRRHRSVPLCSDSDSMQLYHTVVTDSIHSLPRLACRLSASISSAFFIELAFTQRHCKTLFRLGVQLAIISGFFNATSHHLSFHVALQNIHCLHAVAPTPTLLPLNSFLSSFVRQFHFTSRTALPTFITLFQPHSPTKLFFFHSSRRTSSHLTR